MHFSIVCLLVAPFVFSVASGDQQCPNYWQHFEGSCYFAKAGALSPDQARDQCLLKKADLASITSEAEDYFIRGLITKLFPNPTQKYFFAIGMKMTRNNIGDIGKSAWYDNSPVSYGDPSAADQHGKMPWGRGQWAGSVPEPKQRRPNFNCVFMVRVPKSAGDWVAAPCDGANGAKGGFVCKFALEQGKDRAEDTPQAQCSNGYTPLGMNCYKVFESTSANAATAELACQADGGHLATINSKQEDTFIRGMINHLKPAHNGRDHLMMYYIGMHLERDSRGNIESARWKNGDTPQYGDPSAQGFLAGTGPWLTGTELKHGRPQPIVSRDHTAVVVLKNSHTGGGWAAGLPTLTAGYVCQIKSDAGKGEKKVKKVRV